MTVVRAIQGRNKGWFYAMREGGNAGVYPSSSRSSSGRMNAVSPGLRRSCKFRATQHDG
jgi:hypothetical protein